MRGKAQLDRNRVDRFILRIINPRGETALDSQEVKIQIKMAENIRAMRMVVPTGLGFHLVQHRHRHAKDDRDKVYAFANMVCPPIPELYPNYEMLTEEIYYQAAVQLIRHGGDLKVLSVCEVQIEEVLENLTNLDGVPRKYLASWVPNWANRRLSEELWGGYNSRIDKSFAAAGKTTPIVQFHGDSLAESLGILTARGVAIGIVAQVSGDCYTESVKEVIMSGLDLLRSVESLKAKIGDDMTSAVLLTLTLNRDAFGKRTYSEIADDSHAVRDSSFRATIDRILFTTTHSFIGLGPRGGQKEDFVAVVLGCHVPLVLHPKLCKKGVVEQHCDAHEEIEICSAAGCAKNVLVIQERYKVVGKGYLHGWMTVKFLKSPGIAEKFGGFKPAGNEDEVVSIYYLDNN